MICDVIIDGTNYRLELAREKGVWRCLLNGREVKLDVVLTRANVLSVVIDGTAYEVKREFTPVDLHYWVGSARYAAEVRDPRSLRSRRQAAGGADGIAKLVAPMPGKVVRLLVEEKAEVQAGQGVLVVEAMKMQNELKSPKKGTVRKILVAPGAAVNAGDVLAIVE
ncbi:MAG TPA: biotin/lipoyl-containing protein [Terriglobales bacterium]|nr:biotin/lipoyl-containing protein [Terriglobales bacterium]